MAFNLALAGNNQGIALGEVLSVFSGQKSAKDILADSLNLDKSNSSENQDQKQKPEDAAAELKDIIQIFKSNAKSGTSDLAKILALF